MEGVYAKGGVLGAVCHGPCGLVSLVDTATGRPIVDGKRVTGFSDAEEEAIGLLGRVPFSLEQGLKNKGGLYEAGPAFAPHSVVDADGRLVTGQNPSSSKGVGCGVVELLKRTD